MKKIILALCCLFAMNAQADLISSSEPYDDGGEIAVDISINHLNPDVYTLEFDLLYDPEQFFFLGFDQSLDLAMLDVADFSGEDVDFDSGIISFLGFFSLDWADTLPTSFLVGTAFFIENAAPNSDSLVLTQDYVYATDFFGDEVDALLINVSSPSAAILIMLSVAGLYFRKKQTN